MLINNNFMSYNNEWTKISRNVIAKAKDTLEHDWFSLFDDDIGWTIMKGTIRMILFLCQPA